MLICFCKIPLVRGKGHTLFRSYWKKLLWLFFSFGKFLCLSAFLGERQAGAVQQQGNHLGRQASPYLPCCDIPGSTQGVPPAVPHTCYAFGSGCTKKELSDPTGGKKGLGDLETSAAGPWDVPSPRRSPDTGTGWRTVSSQCSEHLAEIPAHTTTLVGASHKMPKSVIYNRTGLKKCFHKLVSCCFALADKCFWNFPITMFYSLYLHYCYF